MVRCSDLGYVLWAESALFRFDVLSFEFKGPEDEHGIFRSRDEVNKLIAQEINNGIPPNRIVLGGFSQGGTMTLVIGLTIQYKLAGLTVLSGRLPIREKIGGVCTSSFVLANWRFDASLAAARIACDRPSHLLGPRRG
jgi:predicted esterase